MTYSDSKVRVTDAVGTVWAYVQNFAARGISLAVFFILVRVLSPNEFGTFAVTMVFLTVGEIFVEQLFGHAIVQRATLTSTQLSSAFWIALLLSIILAIATLVTAPFFATAFDSPGAEPLIMAMSPVFIFMALASVPAALLHRALDYRTLAKRTVLSNLLSGAVAIAAAVGGLGVWSFVLQQLVFHLVSTLVLWWYEPWRPNFRCERKALIDLLSFSSRITFGKILDLVETRFVELVIAKHLGIVVLGNFSLAARAQMAATQLIAAPLWLSSISIFARKQADRTALIASLQERILIASLFVMPCFLFAAATGEVLVPVVFGAQWDDAVIPFQILCLLGAVRSITSLFAALLQGIGAAGPLTRNILMRTVITIGLLPLLLPFGPPGVASCLLLGQLAAMPLLLRRMYLEIGLSTKTVINFLAKPVLMGLTSASLGFLIVEWLVDRGAAQAAIVASGLSACTFVFVALATLLMPSELLLFVKRMPIKHMVWASVLLNALIRFEDSLRVIFYLGVLKMVSCRYKSPPKNQDIVLVLSDATSMNGSVAEQAVLGGLLNVLRKKGVQRVSVLCKKNVAMPIVEGIILNPLPWWGSLVQARKLANTLAAARVFIVVGSDTIDGLYSRYESLLRLGMSAFAARHKAVTVVCSFSISDLPDPHTIRAFQTLPASVKLYCRDFISRDRLCRVVGDRVQLTADLAYQLLPAVSSALEQCVGSWLAIGHRGAGPVIGWNQSPNALLLLPASQRNKAAAASALAIGRLVEERDACVVLIANDCRSRDCDQAMLADIFSRIPPTLQHRVLLVNCIHTAADVKQVCEHFDFVLTGHLNLMIAALGRGVPVLAVEYQAKFAGALAHFQLNESCLLEPLEVCSAAVLYQKTCACLDRLVQTRAQIQQLLPFVENMSSAALLTSI